MPDKPKSLRAVRAATALVALSSAALIVPALLLNSHNSPKTATSVQAASRDSFTLSEPMTLSTEPRIVVRSGTLSVLRDVSPKGIGGTLLQYVTGRRAALALDAADVEIDLTGASPAAGSSANAGAILSSNEVLAALVKALSAFEFRSLSFKDVALEIRLDQGRKEAVKLTSAEFEMSKNGDRIASGTLVYKGEPVTFDLAFGAALETGAASGKAASTDAPRPVRATVKGKYVEGHFDGRLATSDRVYISATSATLSIPNVRSAARWLGEAWPDGQGLGAFTARGSLLLDTRSVEFQNARFTLDGNSASGTLALRLAGERPSIEGTLAFDAFNIGPYTAAKKQTPVAVVSDWLSDLRLPGLPKPTLVTAVDADLRLSAKSIVSNAQILGRTAASLSIKNGVMSAELAELELEQGGTGSGELAIDMRASDPHFTIRGELRNVDFARALENRVFVAPLEGQGNIMIDLAGKGSREDELRASLSGKVELEMLDGGTLGLDLEALPAAAKQSVPGAKPETVWVQLGNSPTKLDRFVARFAGRDGVFSAETFEASAGDTAIVALGNIGIVDGTVDMTVKTMSAVSPEAPITTGSLPGDVAVPLQAQPPVTAYRVRGPGPLLP